MEVLGIRAKLTARREKLVRRYGYVWYLTVYQDDKPIWRDNCTGFQKMLDEGLEKVHHFSILQALGFDIPNYDDLVEMAEV